MKEAILFFPKLLLGGLAFYCIIWGLQWVFNKAERKSGDQSIGCLAMFAVIFILFLIISRH